MGIAQMFAGSGGIATSTPAGAAAAVLSDAVKTGNNSATGATSTAAKYFGAVNGGVNFGTQGGLPSWALIAGLALAALFVFKRLK